MKIRENEAAKEKRIVLNVGGRSYAASKEIFLRWEGTYFHGLVSGGHWTPDDDGRHYIDRDPMHFDRIMTSLRTGEAVDFSGLSTTEGRRLAEEIDYYQLHPNAVRWDRLNCSTELTITDAGRTLSKTGSKCTWNYCAVVNRADKMGFKLRLKANKGVMFGYAVANTFATYGEDVRGWFLNAGTGALRDSFSDLSMPYTDIIETNSVVGATFDETSHTISFEVNGKLCGVPYRLHSRDDGQLKPCVMMALNGCCVSLED